MKTFLSLCTLVASLAIAGAQSFTVNLNGAQDGGGARMGTGSGTLTLSGNNLILNNITYSGLTTPVTVAHIHGPAPVGVSTSVLYDLTPTYTSAGSTSGSINGTLPLVDGTDGFSMAQQLDQLNSSQWYINIHNSTFPGGEIRGQILPVPEPTAMAILGLGALGLVWSWRRKH